MGTTVIGGAGGTDGRRRHRHVGDSRAYLLRDGELRRLSEDHSLVAELVASGQITEDEAERHPQRTVITRVLGAEPTVAGRHLLAGRRRRRHACCSAPTA